MLRQAASRSIPGKRGFDVGLVPPIARRQTVLFVFHVQPLKRAFFTSSSFPNNIPINRPIDSCDGRKVRPPRQLAACSIPASDNDRLPAGQTGIANTLHRLELFRYDLN